MFPLKADDPYINKDGSRTTLGDITGNISGIMGDIDDLDDRLDTAEDTITSLDSRTDALEITDGKIKNKWVIGSTGNTYILSTADGIKTIEDILTEADAALKAMPIPEDSAILLNLIVLPNGEGTNAQLTLNVANNDLYYTTLSNITLQASKAQAVSSTTMAIYSLRLPEPYFSGFAITTSGAGNLTNYLTRKPSSGTTCYIRYSLLHKV